MTVHPCHRTFASIGHIEYSQQIWNKTLYAECNTTYKTPHMPVEILREYTLPHLMAAFPWWIFWCDILYLLVGGVRGSSVCGYVWCVCFLSRGWHDMFWYVWCCGGKHGCVAFLTALVYVRLMSMCFCVSMLCPSWTDSRSLRRLGPCVTCCGQTHLKILAMRRPKSTLDTIQSEAAPISIGNPPPHTHNVQSTLEVYSVAPVMMQPNRLVKHDV